MPDRSCFFGETQTATFVRHRDGLERQYLRRELVESQHHGIRRGPTGVALAGDDDLFVKNAGNRITEYAPNVAVDAHGERTFLTAVKIIRHSWWCTHFGSLIDKGVLRIDAECW